MTTPDIDLIAVERVIRGRGPAPTLSRLEQRQAVHLLVADGLSTTDIAPIVGACTRSVDRWRTEPPPLPLRPEADPSRWRDRAVCAEVGGDLFMPPDEPEHHPVYSAQRAKAVCARCPVRAACLEDAMQYEGEFGTGGRSGVWGGLTPDQRAALAAARRTAVSA